MNVIVEVFRIVACLLFWLVALPVAGLVGISIALSDSLRTLSPKPGRLPLRLTLRVIP